MIHGEAKEATSPAGIHAGVQGGHAALHDDEHYAMHEAASRSIGGYIDDFYADRRHSRLDYLNPVEFELCSRSVQQAA